MQQERWGTQAPFGKHEQTVPASGAYRVVLTFGDTADRVRLSKALSKELFPEKRKELAFKQTLRVVRSPSIGRCSAVYGATMPFLFYEFWVIADLSSVEVRLSPDSGATLTAGKPGVRQRTPVGGARPMQMKATTSIHLAGTARLGAPASSVNRSTKR